MTVPNVFAEGEGWTLYCGDAIAVLPVLGGSNGVITDPPYSSGGAMRGDRTASPNAKYLRSDSKQADYIPTFAGDNRDQRSYLAWSALWLGMCLDLAQPGAVLCCFTDWRQLPVTTDAVQAGGWVWRGVLPWLKPNPRPVAGRFAGGSEFVVWGSAGPMRDEGACLPGHFTANPDRGREHVTQKPLELMRVVVELVDAGGVVLDPFAGSGTTGVAALLSGRRFVGVERCLEHCEVAARRLSEASGNYRPSTTPQLGLLGGA